MADMEDDIFDIVGSVHDKEDDKRPQKKKPFHEDVDVERLLGRRLSEEKKVVTFGAQQGLARPKRWMPPTPEQVAPRPIERQTQSAIERLSYSSSAQQAPRIKLPTQMSARELAERARQKRESQAGMASISYSPRAQETRAPAKPPLQGIMPQRAQAPASVPLAGKPKRQIQFLSPEDARAMVGNEKKRTPAEIQDKKKRAEQARREFFASAQTDKKQIEITMDNAGPAQKKEKGPGIFSRMFAPRKKEAGKGFGRSSKWAAKERATQEEDSQLFGPEKESARAEEPEKKEAPVYVGHKKPIGAMLTRPRAFMPARKADLGAEGKRLAVLEEMEKKKAEPQPAAPAKAKRKGFGLAGLFANIAHKAKPKAKEEKKDAETEGAGKENEPKPEGKWEEQASMDKAKADGKTFKKQEKAIGSSETIDIRTVLDEIYQIIEEKGSVKVKELSNRLGLTEGKIIELATIFEDSKKIDIEYPLFGSPKLVLREKGELDE